MHRRTPRHPAGLRLDPAERSITLFPIYWMFVISAKPAVELFGTPEPHASKSFYWDNYVTSLSNATFRGYMINSLIVATVNALLVTTLALLRLYALSRFELAGKENIFFWTITNRMAPAAVFLLPLFLLFTQVFVIGDWKLYDTKHRPDPALLRVQPAVRDLDAQAASIDGIPKELDEAAMVDGCSDLARS